MSGMTEIDEKIWLKLETPELRPMSAKKDFYPDAIFYKCLISPGHYFLEETPDVIYFDEAEVFNHLEFSHEKMKEFMATVHKRNVEFYQMGFRRLMNLANMNIATFNKNGYLTGIDGPGVRKNKKKKKKKKSKNKMESKAKKNRLKLHP